MKKPIAMSAAMSSQSGELELMMVSVTGALAIGDVGRARAALETAVLVNEASGSLRFAEHAREALTAVP